LFTGFQYSNFNQNTKSSVANNYNNTQFELSQNRNQKFNVDVFCGYSTERNNPGDKVNTLTKIKKVTSGSTDEIATMVDDLYASIITAGTYKAASLKVAEASKAIENAQRDINISFVN